MSAMARRARADISFAGANITDSIEQYLLSVTYTDNQEDTADDLQIRLQDAPGIWLEDWLNQAVAAAAMRGLEIRANFVLQDWGRGGGSLDTGAFELDSVNVSGPPSVVTIKATSLPYTSKIRQTKKTKAWEEYNLSGIANELAGANGMSCMFLSANDPFYARTEQYKSSDIQFLERLCHDAGCSLKATDKMLVIFDQKDYEAKGPVKTIRRGAPGGSAEYLSWRLSTATAGTQYQSCRVSYNDPETGECIEGTAYCEDYDSTKETNQQLEISHKVGSVGEAQTLAEKNLRLHNKFERQISFSFPGEPSLLSGLNVRLEGWGGWDGKYIITQARHEIGSGGYTTSITGRRVLEGY